MMAAYKFLLKNSVSLLKNPSNPPNPENLRAIIYTNHSAVRETRIMTKGSQTSSQFNLQSVNLQLLYIPNTSFSFAYPALLTGSLSPVLSNTRWPSFS